MIEKGKAGKTYILKGNRVRAYNDMQLNLYDLKLCQRLISENATLLNGEPSDTYIAMWTAIFVKFFACFGDSKSRRTLDAKKVFANNENAKKVFYRLMNIRNKSIVHDENNNMQSNAVVGVTDEVQNIHFQSIIVLGGIDSDVHQNMTVINNITINFVENETNKLSVQIQSDLMKMTLDEITSLEEWRFDAKAAMFDVDRNRVRFD